MLKRRVSVKRVAGSIVLVLAAVSFSAAAVNVDVNTPNASIRVGTPQPAPQVTVIEREKVIVKEDHHKVKKNSGKHKGHYKNKKSKKAQHYETGKQY